MGLCTLGVSGGLAVQNQFGGVTLSQAGDFAEIQISNAASPGGPDVSGIFALSGSFVGTNIAVQFLTDVTSAGSPGNPPVYASGNWQNLNNAIRNDTNAYITGVFSPPNATAVQINPGVVTSLFAIRILLVSITSGTMLVGGNTNPGSIVGVDAAILAQIQAANVINKAQVLALSDMNSTDYLSAVGGSF